MQRFKRMRTERDTNNERGGLGPWERSPRERQQRGITPQATCERGLRLLEQLVETGHLLPAFDVADALTNMSPHEGARALVTAKALGLDFAFQLVAEAGADISARDTKGNTLLHKAICNRELETVELILREAKELLQVTNRGGMTALHLCAEYGDVAFMELLISQGAHLNSKASYARTPVHIAAFFNRLQCLKLLVNAGVEIVKQDYLGLTPLHLAAAQGNVGALEVLIQSGASVQLKSRGGSTALHLASICNQPGCMRALLNAGANIEEVDSSGRTALQVSVLRGHDVCVETLLARGPDIERRSKDGWNALLLSARENKTGCMQLLIKAGSNVNVKLERGRSDTAMHLCAREGNATGMQALINGSGRLETRNQNKCTPLLVATTWNRPDCVKVLLSSGANVNARASFGTSLHKCAARGFEECATLLIQGGARLTEKDKWQDTPLHVAVRCNHLGMVRMLATRTTLEEEDRLGWTALHLAVREERTAVVKVLLELGASIQSTDGLGRSVLQAAEDESSAEIVDILKLHIAAQESDPDVLNQK